MTNTPDMSLQAQGRRVRSILLVAGVHEDTDTVLGFVPYPIAERAGRDALTVTEGTVPDDGWVMVPREMTEEMLLAGLDAWSGYERRRDWMRDSWSAILAASPKPTTLESSGMVERLLARRVLLWCDHVQKFAYEREGVGLDASPHLLADEARKLAAIVSASSPSSEQGDSRLAEYLNIGGIDH